MGFRAVVLFVVLLATVGDVRAQSLDFKLTNRLVAGQRPAITVKAGADVASVELDVVRNADHTQFTARNGAIRAGQSATLVFGDAKGGTSTWTGKLLAKWKSGKQESFDLTFDTQTIGDLKITYDKSHLDLAGKRVEIQLSRPAGHAELVVIGEDGNELGRGEAKWKGEPAGRWLPIEWTQRPGNVLRLELKVTSADDLTTLVKLVPWSVQVPHDEVTFESGKSEIRATEIPKLDASYQKIVDAIGTARRADPKLTVRLYVAGHTDRVGTPADNRKLSLDRARAIANWFRERGLPLPVAYAGFGEEAPLVDTPDEKDEPRNRRVDYIVGVEEPLVSKKARATWAITK